MTARLKLFISGLIISLLIMILGTLNFGGFLLVKREYTGMRQEHELYHQLLEITLKLQVDFKDQIRKWDNLLLHGHSREDFEKYYSRFEQHEQAVQAGLQDLILMTGIDSRIRNQAEDFKAAHHDLGQAYREALEQEKLNDHDGILSIDRRVSGIDRSPMQALDTLVQDISVMSNRLSATSGTEMDKLVSLLITVSAICLIMAIILVVYYMLDRRNYEKRLSLAIKRADQANLAKSKFLAHMSHEIRTPMNGIVAAVDMIKETHEFSGENKEAIEVIQTCSDSLSVIVNDILDLSRIEVGKIVLRNEPMDLNGFLRILHKTLQPIAENKNLQFNFNWPNQKNMVLMTDPVRLRQVLLNILTNAIKFTDEGSVSLDAELKEEEEGVVTVQFRISDTGIGIPREKQQDLFKAFTQLDDSHSRTHQGAGLGLTIAKAIVDSMGGSILIESEPGSGSTFIVDLNLAKLQLTDVSENLDKKVHFASVKPPLKTVLIVDDVKSNQVVARGLLKQMHLNVDLANSGFEAIELANAKRYDLILMDIQMPGMDGYETTRLIRQTVDHPGRRPVIIAVTAHAMDVHRQESLENGMNDHLNKPIRRRTLEDCLLQFFTLPEKPDSPKIPPLRQAKVKPVGPLPRR